MKIIIPNEHIIKLEMINVILKEGLKLIKPDAQKNKLTSGVGIFRVEQGPEDLISKLVGVRSGDVFVMDNPSGGEMYFVDKRYVLYICELEKNEVIEND